MFGIVKLTQEEKKQRDVKLRIEELDTLMKKETSLRAASLALSESYQKETELLQQ